MNRKKLKPKIPYWGQPDPIRPVFGFWGPTWPIWTQKFGLSPHLIVWAASWQVVKRIPMNFLLKAPKLTCLMIMQVFILQYSISKTISPHGFTGCWYWHILIEQTQGGSNYHFTSCKNMSCCAKMNFEVIFIKAINL